MSFPSNQEGLTNHWQPVQDIVDVLQGTTADRLQIVQYNNASLYAIDARNLDTASSLTLRCRDASNNVIATFAKNAIVLGTSAANDALALNCNISGKVYLGDSANTDMTVGLTINQGANDDQILAFKSSDVAHGITGAAETDTYAQFRKYVAASGGLQVTGITALTQALGLHGFGVTDDTTKTTGGTAYVVIRAAKKTGTAVGDCGTDANLLSVRNDTTTRLIVDAEGHIHSIGATSTDMLGNGLWFLNDTANANMTLGVTINQGANDNEALALKSDITHGMTTLAETDTYGVLRKSGADSGGMAVVGFSDADVAVGANTLDLIGYHGAAADTTKSTAAFGVIGLVASVKSGTGDAAVGADGNLVVIRNRTTTRFILDGDGDSHQDVGTAWTQFHGHDDIALLNTLSAHLTRRDDPLRSQFAGWLEKSREPLERMKLVTFNEDGHHFVNWSRMHMLVIGAVLQQAEKLSQLTEEITVLKALLPAGEAA